MDQVDRRDFLKGSVCAVAAATATVTAVAENSKTEIDNRSKRISTGKLIVSPPILTTRLASRSRSQRTRADGSNIRLHPT